MLVGRIMLVGFALALVACAPLHRRVPAYPVQQQTSEQIQADIAHCEAWAKGSTDEPGSVAGSAAIAGGAIGAGVGAVFGAVIYALFGLNPAEGAGVGAALGGLTGATQGAASGGAVSEQRRELAYSACMTGRGYLTAR